MKMAKALEGQSGRALRSSFLATLVEILPLMRLLQNICALTALKILVAGAK